MQLIHILALAGAIIAPIAGVIEGYFDEKKRNPEHKKSFTIRVISFFTYSTLIIFLTVKEIWIDTYTLAILYGGLLALLNSLALDISFNVFRKLFWIRIGKTAFTDKMYGKLGFVPASKFFAHIACILIAGVICYHIFTGYSLATDY